MNPLGSNTTSNERAAFAKRFRLLPPGLPLTKCTTDPFPNFRHPSEPLRDWAWQPLNKFADYWHQCYVGFLDVAHARKALDSAIESNDRYDRGLTLCTRADALVELVLKFHKSLMKCPGLAAEESEALRALATRLEPKVPSVAYVNRIRNKRASHLEVPEAAEHPGALTWDESRQVYDGVFNLAAITELELALKAYVQETSVLSLYEWFRFLSTDEFQTWLPKNLKSGAMAILTPTMYDRMKSTRGLPLSSAAAFTRTDTYFVLKKAEMVVLPVSSKDPSAPREAAHSFLSTWRIEGLTS